MNEEYDYKIKENISNNLSYYMEQNNINNKQLANILHVSESTVGKWLLKKSTPRMGLIEKMANYFEIEKSDLIEDKSTTFDIKSIPGVKIIKEVITVPLLGEIACGEPIFCQENYDNMFQWDADLGRPNFMLKARGDSMIDAGIEDGNLVFFKQTPQVENGKIAAVLIDNEVTLKRFYKHDNQIILQPENKEYPPIIIREEDYKSINILGEMIGIYSKGSR